VEVPFPYAGNLEVQSLEFLGVLGIGYSHPFHHVLTSPLSFSLVFPSFQLVSHQQ